MAFARECWKVGIFGEIFVKFALIELVPLMIYHDLSAICRRMCCCFFCDSFIWILRLRMISDFLVLHLSNFKSTGQNGWLGYHQKLNRNTVILKLNGRCSKHWNSFLKHSNGSLWTKLSGILAFTVMSSIDCIARTLGSMEWNDNWPFLMFASYYEPSELAQDVAKGHFV